VGAWTGGVAVAIGVCGVGVHCMAAALVRRLAAAALPMASAVTAGRRGWFGAKTFVLRCRCLRGGGMRSASLSKELERREVRDAVLARPR